MMSVIIDYICLIPALITHDPHRGEDTPGTLAAAAGISLDCAVFGGAGPRQGRGEAVPRANCTPG